MGKPKSITPAQVGTDYNWGEFGSANANGVNLSPMGTSNVQTTQSGIGQYLNELINPSYDNESFRARQELLDASNRQYANQLGAQAMARGARGSATQNILNSIAANRNMDMRQAMTQEDARVQNILSALSGVEGNYFNQANTMGNNVLQRVLANQAAENAARDLNTKKYNQWKDNLISGTASVAGSLIGAYFGGPMGASIGGQAGRQAGNTVNTFRGSTTADGMYGAYDG
jgi:hypothetical protein